MATERLSAEEVLREYTLQMLRQGYQMHEVIAALMSLKIEMANAMEWQQAISDALYRP
jgi:uncharacterized iron-regulated protein